MVKRGKNRRFNRRHPTRPDPHKNRVILGITAFALAIFIAILSPTSTETSLGDSSVTGMAARTVQLETGQQSLSLCSSKRSQANIQGVPRDAVNLGQTIFRGTPLIDLDPTLCKQKTTGVVMKKCDFPEPRRESAVKAEFYCGRDVACTNVRIDKDGVPVTLCAAVIPHTQNPAKPGRTPR